MLAKGLNSITPDRGRQLQGEIEGLAWAFRCVSRLKARFNGLSRWLGGDARGSKAVGVDGRKSCGVDTALEIQRFLRGGVKVEDLARIYTNPNAFS